MRGCASLEEGEKDTAPAIDSLSPSIYFCLSSFAVHLVLTYPPRNMNSYSQRDEI